VGDDGTGVGDDGTGVGDDGAGVGGGAEGTLEDRLRWCARVGACEARGSLPVLLELWEATGRGPTTPPEPTCGADAWGPGDRP
jgi:hypothetical protein